MGAASIRHSLRPLFFGGDATKSSGELRREAAEPCLGNIDAVDRPGRRTFARMQHRMTSP